MRQLGVLIIGTGKIALANHIPGIALSSKAKVVALCDNDPKMLESAARETGISRTYSDFSEAIRDPQVDAVVIATPNINHPPVVLACAEAKKHVLCEKPLALDVTTANQML